MWLTAIEEELFSVFMIYFPRLGTLKHVLGSIRLYSWLKISQFETRSGCFVLILIFITLPFIVRLFLPDSCLQPWYKLIILPSNWCSLKERTFSPRSGTLPTQLDRRTINSPCEQTLKVKLEKLENNMIIRWLWLFIYKYLSNQ